MINVTEQTLNEMVASLVKKMHPQKIFLFGSYATGEVTADSDIDFLIVQDNQFSSRLKEIKKARKALSDFRIAKDILVYNRDEFEKWKNSANHIIGTCLREGKIIYERT